MPPREDHPSDFSTLVIEGPDDRGVLGVRMRSGHPSNRMTAAMHADLARLWPWLAFKTDVRAVLLQGSDGSFSAGSEPELIDGVIHGDGARRAAMLDEARALVTGALDCPWPVVAAVRGGAYGAALGLALLSDICVVAEDAKLADGHARIGVVAGDHAVLVWPLLCGMARAKRLLLLPEPFSGRDAFEMGMVAECVPDAAVEEHARNIAHRLAAAAPTATRWTKRALNHWFRAGLPAFESSLAHEMLTYNTIEADEGAQSLHEQRSPIF